MCGIMASSAMVANTLSPIIAAADAKRSATPQASSHPYGTKKAAATTTTDAMPRARAIWVSLHRRDMWAFPFIARLLFGCASACYGVQDERGEDQNNKHSNFDLNKILFLYFKFLYLLTELPIVLNTVDLWR